MSLPILKSPEFFCQVPSTKQEIKFRPFLVKEEKILYIALESKEYKEIYNAVKKILQSCILTEDIDVEKLAFFDIEYLFLKIRSRSVGENIEIQLKHQNSECNYITNYTINLEDIQVNIDEQHSNKIMLTEEVGVVMKYPDMKTLEQLDDERSKVDVSMDIMVNCIDFVFDHENTYENSTKEEKLAFIEELTQSQFQKIMNFFSSMPKLQHSITWKCEQCGEQETIELEGLQNFFS